MYGSDDSETRLPMRIPVKISRQTGLLAISNLSLASFQRSAQKVTVMFSAWHVVFKSIVSGLHDPVVGMLVLLMLAGFGCLLGLLRCIALKWRGFAVQATAGAVRPRRVRANAASSTPFALQAAQDLRHAWRECEQGTGSFAQGIRSAVH